MASSKSMLSSPGSWLNLRGTVGIRRRETSFQAFFSDFFPQPVSFYHLLAGKQSLASRRILAGPGIATGSIQDD